MQPLSLTRRGRRCSRRRPYARFSRRTTSIFFSHRTLVKLALQPPRHTPTNARGEVRGQGRMNTGFGANRGSRRRLQSACCRPSEKNRQRVRRDGRSGRSHHPVPERPPRRARSENGEMGACAESLSADARTDRWRVAPPVRAPCKRHGPVAHVHPAALARTTRARHGGGSGDAHKRMPCAFPRFSPANPQLAFSRLGPSRRRGRRVERPRCAGDGKNPAVPFSWAPESDARRKAPPWCWHTARAET